MKQSQRAYTIGFFPTIELLEQRPDKVRRIIARSSVNTNSEGYRRVNRLCDENNIELIESDRIINRETKKGNEFIIGEFETFSNPIAHDENHLVLVNPSNAGNLGTIIRSMQAFELNNLAIIKPSVNIFKAKTIRSSMGAVFQTNFEFFSSFEEYSNKFAKHSKYFFILEGEKKLSEMKGFAQSPYSLVFGNESTGLPLSVVEPQNSVSIKQSNKVDSLNLAMSVAVTLYTLYS